MGSFIRSLRFKIVLSVIIPVIVALALLGWSFYVRQQRLQENQLHQTATQVGEMMFGSLHHAMQVDDFGLATHILADVGNIENIDRVQLLDMKGEVILDSLSQSQGENKKTTEPGCIECHTLPPDQMPHSVKLTSGSDVLRIETPVFKRPECMECHAEQEPYLGILLMDVSLDAVRQDLRSALLTTLLTLFAAVIFVAIGIYLIMNWLVVRRVESLRPPLTELAGGNLAIRIPVNDDPGDEIDELAGVINRLARQFEKHTWEQEERGLVRQQAIMEERERIARDLHDGFAQIPTYVQTKAGAVRLMLEGGQIDQAKTHLSQLEDAAKELLVEVREAIISLRLSSQVGSGLKQGLQSYVEQLTRLSGLKVGLIIDPGLDQLDLESEIELQLFRIIQEALTNVRKHSGASKAQVDLRLDGDILNLTIRDDGKGFDQERTRPRGATGFGIKNMAERAQEIGADLRITPEPGGGTRVAVTVQIKKGQSYASAGGG